MLQIQEGMEAFTLAPLTRILGWTAEEVGVLLANVRNEMKDSRIHAYYNLYVCLSNRNSSSQSTLTPKLASHVAWGQKPGELG